ncbi:aldehyde dehydrogenase family protein, partial [Escherichia coli]
NFALDIAQENGEIWFATPPAERAAFLVRTAELMEQQMGPLMGVLVREAGKTYSNAIAEVREAIDFLYYYSAQVANDFDNNT